jgi:arabinofuranosyltransferase
LAVLAWSHRWMSEDGFINLRVLDNLQAGNGPVFNVDERVEAYTSPLWLALLWVGDALVPFLSSEYVAVVLGVACSAVGLAAAIRGSMLLWEGRPPFPAGALVVVALVPFWDFTTSGLDSALSFAWLGLAFLALAKGAPPRATAVLIGLGPLVRPDLTIFAIAFLAVLTWRESRERGRRALLLLVWAGALPVAYQVFRMGYFAALVPNTALAKGASATFWDRGWFYLRDFAGAYWLWVPVVALGACVVALIRRLRSRDALLLVCATLAAALVHALYVVRLGGDFMHARLLLPSLFALLLPVMVVRLDPLRVVAPALAVVAVWAAVAAFGLRAERRTEPYRIDDVRTGFRFYTHEDHPVELADFRGLPLLWLEDGRALREMADGAPVVVALRTGPGPLEVAGPARESLRADVVASFYAIGMASYAAGERVHIVDLHGLADPIGSRLPVVNRHEAGHEKLLPQDWVLGRFAEPGVSAPGVDPAKVEAARRALECGDLRRLVTAVEAPLTLSRFVGNVGTALDLHGLRVPQDPAIAAAELCG